MKAIFQMSGEYPGARVYLGVDHADNYVTESAYEGASES